MPAKKVNKAVDSKPVEKKSVKKETKQKEKKDFEIDLTRDFNESSTFDVLLYRELFMELRKQMDELSLKKDRNDKNYEEYDEAVYNITANAITNCGAQDFLGFCYKKGFYDFCLMNYDKYMKWTLLAAANGNAFSLSKLQVYLTTALDGLVTLDHSVIKEFMGFTDDNYVLYLSKMLCEEIVNILSISAEELVKIPEKLVEQNDEIQKIYDKAKMEASTKVYEKLSKAINSLKEEVLKETEKRQQELKQKREELEQEESNQPVGEEQVIEEQEPVGRVETSNKFKKQTNIKKKFRY